MRQETFTLSQKELQRVSVRHIKRLKKRLREDGEAALAHANRGHPSHLRLPDKTRQAVLRLARSKYAGFNDHHLCEKLTEREGLSLSRETLRRILRKEGLGSPRKRRAPAHRQRRPRVAREGELVQLDGSPHDWLERRGPHLTALGMQDDASGKILAARFFPSETTEGYFHLLQSLLRRFGVPTAKGRVERLWGVLEDRLCSELRLAQACDIHAANRVRKFIADYNRRFARTPREAAQAWRPAPDDLRRICAFLHERIVSNDNVVQWEGRRLQIPPQNRRFSFAGAKCSSTKLSMARSRSTTAIPASNTQTPRGSDIFMLPLG
jgi:transposase